MTTSVGRKPGGTEFGLSPLTPGAPQNGAPGHRPPLLLSLPPKFCWIPRHPPLGYPPRLLQAHAGVVQW